MHIIPVGLTFNAKRTKICLVPRGAEKFNFGAKKISQDSLAEKVGTPGILGTKSSSKSAAKHPSVQLINSYVDILTVKGYKNHIANLAE